MHSWHGWPSPPSPLSRHRRRGGGGVVIRVKQSKAKIGENSVDVLVNLIISVAYDSVSCHLEPFGTSLIIVSLLAMYRSIDLHNQALFSTAEIDDKAPN